MRLNRPAFSAIAGALMLTALFSSPASGLESFKRNDLQKLDVGLAPHTTIEAINGDVKFEGVTGTSASVEIVVDIKARNSEEADLIMSELDLVVEGEEGFLDVRIADAREFYNWLRDEYSRQHSVTVNFYVTGPQGADGSCESVSGDVSVLGVNGRMEASSVSGDVEVRNAGNTVIASSVSGDVGVYDCKGDLDLESVSGLVKATGVGGMVTVETTSGEIELADIEMGVDAETVSGDVLIENRQGEVRVSTVSGDVTVHSRTTGDIDVESVSGSVELAVLPDRFGDVVLASPSGEIASDVPMKVRRQTTRRLEGALGTGSATLRVNTTSGDILLTEL